LHYRSNYSREVANRLDVGKTATVERNANCGRKELMVYQAAKSAGKAGRK
jgi:hypothetical protein